MSTEQEFRSAVDRAGSAFETFRVLADARRAEFLDAIAAGIMALGDILLETCTAESGLPLARITGERKRTCDQLRLFASLLRDGWWVDARIDSAQPDRQPVSKPDIRRMLIPIGPVAVFGASNFPLAFSTAGGDTASALAAGCPVVVKSHSSHPGTNALVASAVDKAARETGMPEGVFSTLYLSHEQAIELVRHPGIKAVGFTGSRKVGMTLFQAAVARPEPIPVYAEMSAVNPMILFEGALRTQREKIADGLMRSVTTGAGQFCTKPGLIIMRESEAASAFLEAFAACIRAAMPARMLNTAIYNAYTAGVAVLQSAGEIGVLAASSAENGDHHQGRPVAHLVSAADLLANKHFADEIFGPATLIVLCKGSGELTGVLRSLEGQLTATIHATQEDEVKPVLDLIVQKAGRVIYGGYPTGVEVCHSMQHGGPFPATTDARSTSVGTAAINRFLRPVAYQDVPDHLLPDALQRSNPLNILRLVDGSWTRVLGVLFFLFSWAAAAAQSPVNLSVTDAPGYYVPGDFTGLSFEADAALPDHRGVKGYFFAPGNRELVNLFVNGGIRSLRLGGGQVDLHPGAADDRSAIDSAFGFAKAAGIKIIYSLSLLNANDSTDALTAKYIWTHYRDYLECFSIGNEPNEPPYRDAPAGAIKSYPEYLSAWRTFAAAILKAVPEARFTGPEAGGWNWTEEFARDEKSSGLITMITHHQYPGGHPAIKNVPYTAEQAIDSMLSPAWLAGEYRRIYEHTGPKVAPHGFSCRLTEANDYLGGIAGASNAMASALWALDYMHWQAARGAIGINFHNNQWLKTCTIYLGPSGEVLANPKACAIKAFDLVSGGRTEPVTITNPNEVNLTGYAVKGDGYLYVTIINKEHGPRGRSVRVALAATGFTRGTAAAMYLVAPGNKAGAMNGITLGGDSIPNSRPWNGRWTALGAPHNDRYEVRLAAASAVIVRIPLAPAQAGGPAGSGEPVVSGLESMAKVERLPLLPPAGTKDNRFISYDASGGNGFGLFQSTFKKYIDDKGELVIFDSYGPGCLYRQQMNIWINDGIGKKSPTLRIKYYFDDDPVAGIDEPVKEFFRGDHAPVKAPFTMLDKDNKFAICYYPFSFRRRLKVTLQDTMITRLLKENYDKGCNWYQYDYMTYPQGTDVRTWSADDRGFEEAVRRQWENTGSDPKDTTGNRYVNRSVSLKPGGKTAIFLIGQQASVASIKLTMSPFDAETFYNTYIRVTWDDQRRPAIDMPVSYFFGGGGWKDNQWERSLSNLLFGFDGKTGGMYCYWPMPFWKNAKIEILNKGREEIGSLVASVAYKPASVYRYPQNEAAYFMAKLTKDSATGVLTRKFMQPYVTAFREGGHGKVVSVNMWSGNFLEDGDEFTYLDNQRMPWIHGDGTEDDFNQGWGGFRYEKPLWGGLVSGVKGSYRIHMNDPYVFYDSIDMHYEQTAGKYGDQAMKERRRMGTNDTICETEFVVCYYKSGSGKGMHLSDSVDVGNAASENLHGYRVEGQQWAGSLTQSYDSYETKDDYMETTDGGRAFDKYCEFKVRLDPKNGGVRLRSRINREGNGIQTANVYVDGKKLAMPWHVVTYSEMPRRGKRSFDGWFDSEYEIPAAYTRGKSHVTVRIEYVQAVKKELNSFYYWIYCYTAKN